MSSTSQSGFCRLLRIAQESDLHDIVPLIMETGVRSTEEVIPNSAALLSAGLSDTQIVLLSGQNTAEAEQQQELPRQRWDRRFPEIARKPWTD